MGERCEWWGTHLIPLLLSRGEPGGSVLIIVGNIGEQTVADIHQERDAQLHAESRTRTTSLHHHHELLSRIHGRDGTGNLFGDWSCRRVSPGDLAMPKAEANPVPKSTIATYQTLRQESRLAKFDATRFKGVIVDEAHHAAAPR